MNVIEAFNREHNTVHSENGLDILFIRNYEAVRISALISYDVIILEYHDPSGAGDLLNKIRAASYEDVYLIPCFLLKLDAQVDPLHLALADGIVERVSIASHHSIVERIISVKNDYKAIKTDFVGRQVVLKLIRFLHSRDIRLKPVPSSNTLMGYSFPFLDANSHLHDYQENIEILKVSVDRGFLSPHFEDVVHLCSNCGSGFINYREVCPKCGTRKHFSEYSIHHFVCGYVGPESDFFQDKKLVCPKCNRQLRHIGVDYDKPSRISECENGHVFQEPEIETYCFNCGDTNKLESIIDYEINTYELTATGVSMALSGITKEESNIEEIDGVVSFSVFKTLLKVEAERRKLTKGSVSVSYISFLFTPKTIKAHLDSYDQFTHQIAALVRNLLQPTEVLTLANDDTFLVMSPEADMKETKKRLQELSSKLKSVLQKQFETTDNDRILVDSFEMEDKESVGILEQINEHINIL